VRWIWTSALSSLSGVERPVTAFVVSEESKSYRPEIGWMANTIDRRGKGTAIACKPEDIIFTEDALFARLPDGREEKLDVLYRNFEMFDLLNVPKQELMLYAARHNRVKMTPPPKPQFEEKSSFALLHHPLLESLWRKELTDDVFVRLRALFPQTWILDPRPLPPQAAIREDTKPNLTRTGRTLVLSRALARKRSVRLFAAHVAHQVYLELHIVRKLLEQLARVVLVEQQVGEE